LAKLQNDLDFLQEEALEWNLECSTNFGLGLQHFEKERFELQFHHKQCNGGQEVKNQELMIEV